MGIPLISQFTDEEVEEMLTQSYTLWDFAQKLGYKNKSGNVYKSLKARLKERGFDILKYPHLSRRLGTTKTLNDVTIFSKNRRVDARLLKKKLREAGVEYECAECGISDWNGKELSLQVDHINGVNDDNRLENLRFMCPNCHTQTSTWGFRNLNNQ